MKYILFVIVWVLSFSVHAEKLFDIDLLKQKSISGIYEQFPKVKGHKLLLVNLDVDIENKVLSNSQMVLFLVDKNSLHADEISKYAYHQYVVSFNITTASLIKITKGGWGSYKKVGDSEIK